MQQNENRERLNKGGVLMIGSLYWDKSKLRKEWRLNDLDMDGKVLIKVPIRYGRISQSRNDTYSMVFSRECKSLGKLGQGYFVPFKKDRLTQQDIKSLSKRLIDAEYNRHKELDRFNWGWGCLGLLINPKLEEKEQNKLKEFWRKNYSSGFNPKDYDVKDDRALINKNGLLDIDWPYQINHYDFLIATLTKPEVEKYPSPKECAEKIVLNDYDEYFTENRKYSISTFQDDDIEEELSRIKNE